MSKLQRFELQNIIFTESFRSLDSKYVYTNTSDGYGAYGNRVYFTNGSFTIPSTPFVSYMYRYEGDNYAYDGTNSYKNGVIDSEVITITPTGFTGVTGYVADLIFLDRVVSLEEIENFLYNENFDFIKDNSCNWELDDSTDIEDTVWKRNVSYMPYVNGSTAYVQFSGPIGDFSNATITVDINTTSSYGRILYSDDGVNFFGAGIFDSSSVETDVDRGFGDTVVYTVDGITLVAPTRNDLYLAIADGIDHTVVISGLDLSTTSQFNEPYNGDASIVSPETLITTSAGTYNSYNATVHNGFIYQGTSAGVWKHDLVTGADLGKVSDLYFSGITSDDTYFYGSVGVDGGIRKYDSDFVEVDSYIATGRYAFIDYYKGALYYALYSAVVGTEIQKLDLDTEVISGTGYLIKNGTPKHFIVYDDTIVEVFNTSGYIRAYPRNGLSDAFLWEKSIGLSYFATGYRDNVYHRIICQNWDKDIIAYTYTPNHLRIWKNSGEYIPADGSAVISSVVDYNTLVPFSVREATEFSDGFIYAQNYTSSTIVKMLPNLRSMRYHATVDITSQLAGMTHDGINFYLAREDGTVKKYDSNFNELALIGTYPVNPKGISYRNGYIYAGFGSTTIYKMDVSDGTSTVHTLSVTANVIADVYAFDNYIIAMGTGSSYYFASYDINTYVRKWVVYTNNVGSAIVYNEDQNTLIQFRSQTNIYKILLGNTPVTQSGTAGSYIATIDSEWGDGSSYEFDYTQGSDFSNQSANPIGDGSGVNVDYYPFGYGSDVGINGLGVTDGFSGRGTPSLILDGIDSGGGAPTLPGNIGRNISGKTGLTFTGWITKTDIMADYGILAIMLDATTPKFEVKTVKRNITLTIETSPGNTVTLDCGPIILDTNWYHIAAVADLENDMLYMYINGILFASGAGTGESSFDGTFHTSNNIFADSSGLNLFNGGVSDFRLYEKALTQIEINSIMDIRFPYDIEIGLPIWELDVSTLTLTRSTDITATLANLQDFSISPDGTHGYGVSISGFMRQYTLTTPYNMATAVLVASKLSIFIAGYCMLHVSSDGMHAYVLDDINTSSITIYEYAFGTAWDITTLTTVRVKNLTNYLSQRGGMAFTFNYDGTIMLHGYRDTGFGTIYRYNLSTPWDMSTAVFHSSKDFGTISDGIAFSIDGSTLIRGESNIGTYQYELTTPFDITSATTQESSVSRPWNMTGMCLLESAERIYVTIAGDKVEEYHF